MQMFCLAMGLYHNNNANTTFLYSFIFLHLVLFPILRVDFFSLIFFAFSFPNLLISDISVLSQISIHHASTITSYVSIVMALVTFNFMWGHIIFSCLNIYFISPAIYNLMSKVSTIKTMTIK
jgi:hypothetical protein